MDIIDSYYNFACFLWHKKNCVAPECKFNLSKFSYEILDGKQVITGWCRFLEQKPTDADLMKLDINEVLKMVENQPYETGLNMIKENPILYNFMKKYLRKEMKKTNIDDDDIINFSINTL